MNVYPDDGSIQWPGEAAVKPSVFREGHTEAHLTGIRHQIERGEYQVDAAAVADAIMRRLRELAEARELGRQAQNECSYPASGSSESMNTTPGSPSTTDPMNLSSDRSAALAARIIAALHGKQANNS
jgi:plasmid stabilization system protein ParE